MMQINVSQQLQGHVGSKRDYKVSDTIDINGNGQPSQVEGEVTLTRTNRSILVNGQLRTALEVACGRCLTHFTYPLALHIEEEYFPSTDMVSGAPLPPPDEPGSFTIDEHHTIDLTEALRQYALLAVPMKPLCTEDCAGLCPDCGQNLNRGNCNCRPDEIDPRWTVLKQANLN